jgi:hypothetical protein
VVRRERGLGYTNKNGKQEEKEQVKGDCETGQRGERGTQEKPIQ